MNMTRATRQIRPARIPNQESSAPIRVPSPLPAALAKAGAVCVLSKIYRSRRTAVTATQTSQSRER